MADEAGRKTGVVLLHGKGGLPESPQIWGLARNLKREGFAVLTPELPYSKNRKYDKSCEETVSEIDRSVAELKKLGADKVFVVGHSLGANVALYYVTMAKVDGVVAVAPGHRPEAQEFQTFLAGSVELARKMIKEGKGGRRADFTDMKQGRPVPINVAAKIYLSWFAPDGPAVMPRNAGAIKPGTPLLWVIGTRDIMYEKGPSYAFDKAPPHEKNKYVAVESDHKDTPVVASGEIIKWLKSINDR